MKRFLYALLIAYVSLPAFSQGVRYDSNVTTSAKNVPVGAQAPVLTLPYSKVTICTYPASPAEGSPCTNLASIYSDEALTQPILNPITTDSEGRFGFWIAPALYGESIVTSGGTYVGTFALSLDSPPGPQGPGGIGCGAANCIIAAPAASQVIAQPSGTTLSSNSLQNVLYADQFTGADAGAKINAADTRLGASAGTIIYNAAAGATASTNVTLSANHKLILQSPISWTATITLPDGSSGQDISCPALQTLSYATASTWVSGKGISNASLHDCNVTSTITTGTLDTVASFAQATNVTVSGNSVANAGLVVFGSSAATTACEGGNQCQYPNVTDANSSAHITISGNHGTAAGGEFIYLNYTNGATISGNVGDGYTDGVVWWGGDSCITGCTAGGNGAMANARKTTNLSIADNVFTAVKNACIWGSMGQYVIISGNNCVGAIAGTDVGIDLEGTWDSTVSHNAVTGFFTGDLATFFLSTRVSFIDNSVTGVTGAPVLISTHNATNVPDGLIQTFSGNDFNCTDTTVCGTSFQAAEIYNITDNHFHNVPLTLTNLNISQIVVSGNDFSFDVASGYGIFAITSSRAALSANGQIIIRGNTILSSATQASGTQAIVANGKDFNNTSNISIEGNTAGGVHAFPVGLECDAASDNPGVATYCTLLNNSAAGTVVTNSGSSGAPVYVQRIASTQIASATPCSFTPGAIGSNCTMSITLPYPEPDTDYVITGCQLTGTGDGLSIAGAAVNTSTTAITVSIIALDTTYGGGTGKINCMVVHP